MLNRWVAAAVDAGVPVLASRDWHPSHHLSFTESGGEWPVHCVQDSPGARFHPGLRLPESAIVVTKGVRFDRDQYSAFDETGLAAELQKRGVHRVWIGGLAQDVCVRATVLDARRHGLDAIVIADATRPVTAEGGARANDDMRQAGARFETTQGPPLKGAELERLWRDLNSGWRVVDEHHLEKEYPFPDFREALDFTVRIGELAEAQDHHPDVYLAWGKVRLTIWTHRVGGLTERDFIFAAKADQVSVAGSSR